MKGVFSMKTKMKTEFIQKIDELLYLEDWLPRHFSSIKQRIKDAETEEELLSLEFGRAESAINRRQIH